MEQIIEKHCPFKKDTAYQEVGDRNLLINQTRDWKGTMMPELPFWMRNARLKEDPEKYIKEYPTVLCSRCGKTIIELRDGFVPGYKYICTGCLQHGEMK